MSAVVRLYTYSGVLTAPVAPSSGRFSSDSVGLLKNRYLGRAMITADTIAAQSTTTDLTPEGTFLLQIMVQPSKVVHYEVFPDGYSGSITEATSASPYISGTQLIHVGPRWLVSLLEASF